MNRLSTTVSHCVLRRTTPIIRSAAVVAPASRFILPSTNPVSVRSYAKKTKKPDKFAPRAPMEEAPSSTSEYDVDEELKKLDDEAKKISERLHDDLAKLRAGSADPGIVGKLDVVVDKAKHVILPLRDVAHVVTKGRALAVTVYEVANVKKVISAIQVANLNMQPVQDPKDPQLVNVPLPPPTKESRIEIAEKMVTVGQKAQDGLKNARAKTRKGLQGAEKEMRPDSVKKATKKLEDVVKRWKSELEGVVEKAKKGVV